jgi:hypothetical protein
MLMRGEQPEQAMEETTIDNVTDTDLRTLTVADDDASVAEFLADVYRNERAIEEADLLAMEQQMQAEISGSDFGDLTPQRHAEIMEGFPVGRGWFPVLAFNADSRMFAAELRRGTPAGPDVARLGNYLSAECALMVATAFAREMVIASEIGDDAWKDRIRAKITYATPR